MNVLQSTQVSLLVYSHLLSRARTGRGGSAPSLVTAAFCLDQRLWGLVWDDAETAFKILQVFVEQGLLIMVWEALCVPSGGSLGHSHLQSIWAESGNVHVSTSPCPCNRPQRVSVPHNCVSLILHFQPNTQEFQIFSWEFHLPAKMFACKAGAKSFFGSFPCADLYKSGWVLQGHLAAFCGSRCRPSALLTLESIDFLVVTSGGQLFWWKGM